MLVKKIAYNTIVSAISRIAGTLLALVTVGLMTRYLGQNGFGSYSTILAFLYIFSVFADLGLYAIAVREISKQGANEQEIMSHAFSLRLLFGLAVFILAPLIAVFLPYSFEIKIGVAIGAIGYWFLSNTQVLIGIFQKYLKTDRVAVAETASRVVQLGLVAFVVWKNLGFLMIVATLALSGLVNFLLVWLFAQKYVPVKLVWNPVYWKKMIRESFPLAISAIFVLIYFKLDTVMLSLMKSASDVGIYSVAYKILENLIYFPAMFVGLIMPLFSKHASSNHFEFKKVAQKTFAILLIFALPMVVATFFLSKLIVSLIAGGEFFASAGVLNVLIIATAIIFFGSLFSNMIVALGKQQVLAKIYAFGAAVNFSVNLFLIPRFTYWGAASSTVFTEFLVTVLMAAVIYRATKYLPSLLIFFKTALAAGLMALVFYFLKENSLLVAAGASVLIYFIAVFLLGIVRFGEVKITK